jgi:hypothetical protein
MPCSPAQLEANKKNAERSTGPRTPEGKAISRANSYKHGLTGEGIVLAHEDAAEAARRAEAMQTDMAPKNELARNLVIRVVVATMRLERCALHEAKMTACRMRHAHEQFDDAHLAEVEKAISWIAAEPATHVRRLRGSLEGLARLIEKLEALKKDLLRPQGIRWDYQHCDTLHHYLGLRRVEVPYTRARCLGEAIYGTMDLLNPDDGPKLSGNERKIWAADRLVELIDGEIAKLEALKATIDIDAIELDRSEAQFRAMFDPSKEAILARKYEAAIERGLYRALQEYRAAQDLPPQVSLGKEFESEPNGELGSSPPAPLADEDATAHANEADAQAPVGAADRSRRPDPVRARRQATKSFAKKRLASRNADLGGFAIAPTP